MYIASNDGITIRWCEQDYQPVSGEVEFDEYPTAEQLNKAFSGHEDAANNEDIKKQIIALESQQTPRRIREAIAEIDGGWMEKLEDQIAALRAQLT